MATVRRRQHVPACIRCHVHHLACDLQRPCTRCVRLGVVCRDVHTLKRRRRLCSTHVPMDEVIAAEALVCLASSE